MQDSQLPARLITQSKRDPAEGVMGGAPPGFGQPVLPHIHTVNGRYGVASHSYLNMDEALRDSRANAERMRADCGIMECLQARELAVALLPWHIEPEDSKDPRAVELARRMTRIVSKTPHFTEIRRQLLMATWYGRYAVAVQYGAKRIDGEWKTAVRRTEPRHGDKLVFRYDEGDFQHDPEQIGIRVNSAWRGARMVKDPRTGQLTSKVQPTEQGLVYWFDRHERDTLILHRHMAEDGPYHEPWMAGRINGVGIRDRIYWTWYAMIECLQRVIEFLDRAAFGVEIWPYQVGNPKAKKETEHAALNAMGGGRTVILAPLPPDENPERYMPMLMEPGLGGVATTIDIIRTYFGHKIKRYILGQTLTSEADATGMGSGVADAHLATFADIAAYDARNLEETLTSDFLHPLQRWNYRGSEEIDLQFRIDTESPNVQEKMQAMKQAWEMGARIKAEEVYETIGASLPNADDEVLSKMAMQPAMPPGAPQPGVTNDQNGSGGKVVDIESMMTDASRKIAAANTPPRFGGMEN